MAQVDVIRDMPIVPPIKEVRITLTENEARNLSALLGSGITVEAKDLLGLDSLYKQLNRTFPFQSLPFKAVAYLQRGF